MFFLKKFYFEIAWLVVIDSMNEIHLARWRWFPLHSNIGVNYGFCTKAKITSPVQVKSSYQTVVLFG